MKRKNSSILLKSKTMLLIAAATTLLILIVVPYLKTEYLTAKHGADFSELYQSIGMFEDIEYTKVMEHSETKATVYYVVSEKAAGVLAEFESNSGIWELVGWETIWSSSGGADNFMWPYYR